MMNKHIAVSYIEEKQADGIFVSETKVTKPNMGDVLYVPFGSDFIKGDTVMFSGFYEITEVEGVKMFVVHEDDITAIL